MIDSEVRPNGGLRIEIDDKSEDLPAHIASAVMSRALAQMQTQAAQTIARLYRPCRPGRRPQISQGSENSAM
jgi:hypothetical protein